jgi:glycosyltransferase involved in cell wall biosynthesis
MIGSGPAAAAWKEIARQIESNRVQVQFHGWLESARKDAVVAASDLLVVPSIWPEPFGQVGLEAAGLGVPAVAFDVGGVRNWLRHGVNGFLAPSDPPTAHGLAESILKALRNPADYARMRAEAKRVAKEFTVERHVRELTGVFNSVLKNRK